MTTPRPLTIGLSLTATWLKGQTPRPLRDPVAFNVDLARMAEAAKLDFVFKPDALYLPVQMSGGPVGLDPLLALTAVALATENIGLVATISTSFTPPFLIARQLQSLNWISKGRAGWNIVTSIEGAENFGAAPLPAPQIRYRKAAECTDVVRQLWASNPAPDGPPQPLSPVNHHGEHFSVRGPLNIPAYPAGEMPLFQAGASQEGRDFAARVAHGIFAAAPDLKAAQELRADLRARAARFGRDPDQIRLLPGLYFFLATSREEAIELHRRAHSHLGRDRRLASLHSVLGADFSHLSDDTKLGPEMLPKAGLAVRSRTHADLLRRFITETRPTLGEVLARPEVTGSAHWVSVGTVEDVLADILRHIEAGAIDGFIALPGGSEGSMRLFFEELMPKLQDMGLFRREYAARSLRAHLGLPPDHAPAGAGIFDMFDEAYRKA